MTKTNPTWPTTIEDAFAAGDKYVPAEASGVGSALNTLIATVAPAGATRVGIDSAKFEFDGQQDVQNLLISLLRNVKANFTNVSVPTTINSASVAVPPHIALLSDNTLLCVYRKAADTRYLYCKQSTDNGTTWLAENTVFDAGVGKIVRDPFLLPRAGSVMCFFSTNKGGTYSIKSMASVNAPATWGTETTVFADANNNYYPCAIKLLNNNLFCIFNGGAASQIYSTTYNFGTSTWSGVATSVCGAHLLPSAWPYCVRLGTKLYLSIGNDVSLDIGTFRFMVYDETTLVWTTLGGSLTGTTKGRCTLTVTSSGTIMASYLYYISAAVYNVYNTMSIDLGVNFLTNVSFPYKNATPATVAVVNGQCLAVCKSYNNELIFVTCEGTISFPMLSRRNVWLDVAL